MKRLNLIYALCIGLLPCALFANLSESDMATFRQVWSEITTHPPRVQVDISAESIAKGITKDMGAISEQLRKDMDDFFKQMGESLPKMGPGIEALGKSSGNAIVPMRNEMLKGLFCGVAIVVIGILIKTLCSKYIARYMFEPSLASKKSRKGILSRIASWFKRKKPLDLSKHMVISDQLKEELQLVIAMTTNIRKHGGQFDNILLKGAPGTGKTLFAQLLAEQCGMDYAIIPAANVSQFLASGQAVVELNKLFEWAAKSKNGTILFFDEAEVFLADRGTLALAAQNALTAFLAHTGTPSHKIMIMAATNRPEVLDEAVRSRFGVCIEFPLPDAAARQDQLVMHIKKTFAVQKGSRVAYDCLKDPSYVAELARRTEGWSGRTIQKFVNRLRQQALAEGDLVIHSAGVDRVMKCMHVE